MMEITPDDHRHGCSMLGYNPPCPCVPAACGGVAAHEMRDDCPEHNRSPALLWHWASACPALTADEVNEAG